MIITLNNYIEISRKNTYIVTLAAQVNSVVLEVKNYYEMTCTFEPVPNPNNTIQKLYYNAIKDLQELKSK